MRESTTRFLDEHQIVAAIIPVDSQAGANNGDWVSMKFYDQLVIVVFKAAGVAGDDPVLKLQQATVVAGSDAKDLLFTRVDSKVGAQTGIALFTEHDQVAATSYVDAVSAEAQGLFVIEVRGEDLDRANGFDCVQLSIADTGSAGAQLLAALYILGMPRYMPPQTAIVD